MASYAEIFDLLTRDGALMSRTSIALLVAADSIRANGSATVARQKWATMVLANPRAYAPSALALALVQNRNVSVAELQGASDAALQSAVDGAVAMLVAGAV
jgi:hypothetical protein